jgi:hypothetical protein
LPVGELTRRRRCDIAGAVVSHLDSVSLIKMERKVKARSGGSATPLRVRTVWRKLASMEDTLRLP